MTAKRKTQIKLPIVKFDPLLEEIAALDPRGAFAPEYRTPLQTMLRDPVGIGSPSFLPRFHAS